MRIMKHHHGHGSHSYERLVKVEEWMGRLIVPIAIAAMAAALAFGLLTSTGHVTW